MRYLAVSCIESAGEQETKKLFSSYLHFEVLLVSKGALDCIHMRLPSILNTVQYYCYCESSVSFGREKAQ